MLSENVNILYIISKNLISIVTLNMTLNIRLKHTTSEDKEFMIISKDSNLDFPVNNRVKTQLDLKAATTYEIVEHDNNNFLSNNFSFVQQKFIICPIGPVN
ncbi:hypothetical protein BpHYR1_007427 [Brachionus plicatilis]|uniref:Uncharacterized protein n=1 Tax=Brachionus plicatilis TaxID=10195 RepID=A0A3M7SMD8_BRAPC|nr:hypothetical protein BpHYR1_007427 [Brachionus plicatilis]